MDFKLPPTLKLSFVVRTMELTLLESSMMLRTLAKFGPTSVTIPTRPLPAMTFMPFLMPSLEPLSIVKLENQLVPSMAITFAATF